jgi:hypothetical protein
VGWLATGRGWLVAGRGWLLVEADRCTKAGLGLGARQGRAWCKAGQRLVQGRAALGARQGRAWCKAGQGVSES